jgi:MoxR-like ATPase
VVDSSRSAERYGLASVDDVVKALEHEDYLVDEGLATTVFLALSLQRPLLLEGEAGVGKTEIAHALAQALGVPVIRLQCYEGIDASQAVYEWNYSRQLLHLRAVEAIAGRGELRDLEEELYSQDFLLRRPLLSAIDASSITVTASGERRPPVLLIDEIDRADDEFEAFLLEVLSDYAITIPELGRVRAELPPITILTSNRTRDLHDALKRRCLYHWVAHPSFEREVEIICRRAPEVEHSLARQVAAVASALRDADLYKPPGIAETLDWARSLTFLSESEVTAANFRRSSGALLKYREDGDRVQSLDLAQIIRSAVLRGGSGNS